MTRRLSVNEITSDQLDALYARLSLYSRAVNRTDALVEEWTGDQTPITRAEAAELIAAVSMLHGWVQTDMVPRPELTLVAPAVPSAAGPGGEATR